VGTATATVGSNGSQVSTRIDGYPSFAAYLASDPRFHVGRDYKEARIRVRLHKMYAVEKLQGELATLDRKQRDKDPSSVYSIAEDHICFDSAREKLIAKLDVALRELGEWMIDVETSLSPVVGSGGQSLMAEDEIQLREVQCNALPRLSSLDRRSLQMYLYHRKPMFKEEEEMFLCGPELVSLGQSEQNSWLDNAVESWIHKVPYAQVGVAIQKGKRTKQM
jgi:hypothetical protein